MFYLAIFFPVLLLAVTGGLGIAFIACRCFVIGGGVLMASGLWFCWVLGVWDLARSSWGTGPQLTSWLSEQQLHHLQQHAFVVGLVGLFVAVVGLFIDSGKGEGERVVVYSSSTRSLP